MKKYQEIADQMSAYIQKNKLKQGDQLPKIIDLVNKFQVGKSTILKALALLDKRGIVYNVQGSGIFVRRPEVKGYITTNNGFAQQGDKSLVSKILDLEEIKAPVKVQKAFHCRADEKFYKVHRLRIKNGTPFYIETSYYRKSVVPFLSKAIAESSIFDYLQQGLKLGIRFSDTYMQVIKLNEKQAKLLELKKDDPALFSHEIYYLNNGMPFDYSELIFNYKIAKFFNQSSDELV